MSELKRILTGDRTTGKLHLGHYVGSLRSRVNMQHDYDTWILLADIQALTTHFKDPSLIKQSLFDVAVDNLSAGLDPNKVIFVQQSAVPAIAELTVFYSMLVTVNVLRHNPTIKTEAANYGYDDMTYGFLGYPVSQAADITFCDAHVVPVGDDQLPHMELTRKIVRRFNDLYGNGTDILIVPTHVLSDTPRLPGVDGAAKMGKSLGNAIFLSDSEKEVTEKVRMALTDKNRIAKTDPGDPSVCTVFKYHCAFNAVEKDNIAELCRAGQIGCVACKKNLTTVLNTMLAPLREKRSYYEAHPSEVYDIIYSGTAKACQVGSETVARVKNAMGVLLDF